MLSAEEELCNYLEERNYPKFLCSKRGYDFSTKVKLHAGISFYENGETREEACMRALETLRNRYHYNPSDYIRNLVVIDLRTFDFKRELHILRTNFSDCRIIGIHNEKYISHKDILEEFMELRYIDNYGEDLDLYIAHFTKGESYSYNRTYLITRKNYGKFIDEPRNGIYHLRSPHSK